MRKLSAFTDTAAPIAAAQIGGASALHRGGGGGSQLRGEPIVISSAQNNAGNGPMGIRSGSGKSLSSSKGKTNIFGKKPTSTKSKKIEYGSTLPSISSSGTKISKGNLSSNPSPGVKVANVLSPGRYAGSNPMSALNVPRPMPTPRPAPRPSAPARPSSMALRGSQSVGASKVSTARPASPSSAGLGGPA